MKAMLTGFAVMAVISVGAYFVLHQLEFSSQARTAGPAVRVD